jgi:translation initiation factor IF-2
MKLVLCGSPAYYLLTLFKIKKKIVIDIAVLVLDINVGVGDEIIKLLKLLRLFRKDFILVIGRFC